MQTNPSGALLQVATRRIRIQTASSTITYTAITETMKVTPKRNVNDHLNVLLDRATSDTKISMASNTMLSILIWWLSIVIWTTWCLNQAPVLDLAAVPKHMKKKDWIKDFVHICKFLSSKRAHSLLCSFKLFGLRDLLEKWPSMYVRSHRLFVCYMRTFPWIAYMIKFARTLLSPRK